MANKANTISAINTFITAVVTVTKVRNAFLELVNTLFQTTTTQTLTTGSNVFWYDLRYKKIGNIVFIDGYIQSKFSVVKPSTTVAVTIPNSLFFAKTGQDTFALGFPAGTGTNVILKFSDDEIILGGSISPNQTILINSSYQTND